MELVYTYKLFSEDYIEKLYELAIANPDAINERALEEYIIIGINTNIQLHQKIIQSEEFLLGSYDINFMAKFE